MKTLSLILSLAIIGIAAAFFKAAEPHQVPPVAVEVPPRGGATFLPQVAFVDEGLDNPNVQADDSIDAARKCGFCMGVS